MNRRKMCLLLMCSVVVLLLIGVGIHKDFKGNESKSVYSDVKDKELNKENRKKNKIKKDLKATNVLSDNLYKKQKGEIDIVDVKEFAAQEPKKGKTLNYGNMQDSLIIEKDLSYLENDYLYNINTNLLSISDYSVEELYGYDFYKTNENAQLFYKAINNAMGVFINQNSDVVMQDGYFLLCILDYLEYGINQEDAMNIYYIYRHDHPEYYWLSATLIVYDNGIGILTDEEYASAQVREDYNKKIEECIDEFILNMENMGWDEKIRYVHDTIIKNIDYAYEEDGVTPQSANWAHNIIGYVCKKGVVCEGYAKMFQLILNEVDIDVIFVTGTANGVDHAWNIVKMSDDKWYWIDLTWDDEPDWNDEGVAYFYYCCPKELFSDTHIENTVNNKEGDYLYDLPETSNMYTYYCASADNSLFANTADEIINEVVEKTKIEINNGKNCVIFSVDDEVYSVFLNTLFSGYKKSNGEITYYYQMFMDALPETVGKVSNIKCRLIENNYYIFFETQDYVNPVVRVKKNNETIGEYYTLIEAFSSITDKKANYQMVLINETEALVFPKGISFPEVKSLSVEGCKIPVEDGYLMSSFFLPENLYITQDFKVKDLNISGMSYNDNIVVNIGEVDFTVSGDGFSIGGFTTDSQNETIVMKGEENSRFIVDDVVAELNVSAFFSETILKNGTLIIRGKEYNFGVLRTYDFDSNNCIEFSNINKKISINIEEIFASSSISISTIYYDTININGDVYVYSSNLNFHINHTFGNPQINMKGKVFGLCQIGHDMSGILYEDYSSYFSESYIHGPDIDIENVGFYVSNAVDGFDRDEFGIKKDEEGNIYVSKQDNTVYQSDNYAYRKLTNGTCELLEETDNDNILMIPEEIDGYPVSKIGKKALNNMDFLCDEKNNFFTVEDGVLYSKDKKILYKYSASNMGKSYAVNDGTEEIKEGAFRFNDFIEEIIISSSVKKIKEGFVISCNSLEKISVDEKNLYFCSENDILFDKAVETLLFYPCNKKDVNYEVPHTVVKIESGAIANNNIVCLKVNENCQYVSISQGDSLKKLYLPDSLKYINFVTSQTAIYAPSYKVAYEFAIAEGLNFVLTSGEFSYPTDLKAQTNQGMVQLEWSRSNYAEKYQIYRKEEKQTTYVLLDTVTDLSYIDFDVVVGKKYLYYVVAVRNDQTEIVYSEPSEEIEIVVSDKTILNDDGYDVQGLAYLLNKEDKTAQVGLSGLENTSQYKGIRDGKVIIPSSVEYGGVNYRVTKIGDYAFCNNSKLEEISIPESIISIGKMSFWNSGLFGDVEIPEKVEIIGVGSFSSIYNLNNIVVDENNNYYSSQEGVLLSKDGSVLVTYPLRGRRDISSYIVPDSVKKIGAYSFFGVQFPKVYLPDTVEEIENNAFATSHITEVELPNVVTIEEKAFNGCSELEYVNLGDKLEMVGSACFVGCKKLKGIYIPDSVEKIEGYAFAGCDNLEYVVGCKNAEFEGEHLFSGCYKLNLLMLPEKMKILPEKMIYHCSSLQKLFVPETVTELFLNSLTNASDGLVLYGQTGGAVEEYANNNLIKFESANSHAHNLKWSILEEENNLGKGLNIYKCDVCNYVEQVLVSQNMEHNWGEWEITEEADCENDGNRKRICKDCGVVQEQIISKWGHKYETPDFEWIDQDKCVAKIACKNEGCENTEEYSCQISKEIVEGTNNIHPRIVSIAEIIVEGREYISSHEEIMHVAQEAVKENIIEETCTMPGHYDEVVYCKICQLEMERTNRIVPATGHTWSENFIVIKEPTCTETGLQIYKCKTAGCTEVKEEEMRELGHDISDEWTVDREATCMKEGEKSHHCIREGCQYREDITTTELVDHIWNESYIVIKEPTCTETGLRIYKCKTAECTEVKEEKIGALGHDISDEWTVDREATCMKEGEKSHHCIRGGCQYRENITTTELVDHMWNESYIVTKEPTCTETGLRIYKCKTAECTEVKEEKIGALGHDISDEWTVDREATCMKEGEKSHHCIRKGCTERKDKTIVPVSKKHVYDSGKVVQMPTYVKKGIKVYTCLLCKYQYRESIPELSSVPQNGDKITDTKSGIVYTVTKTGIAGAEVAYTKLNNKNTSIVVIPDEVTINEINYKVTSIRKNAFSNNKKITKVFIGNNVKIIGANAFSKCTKLKYINMTSETTTISNKAFYNCTSLIKAIIPPRVNKIGNKAFCGCKKLKLVTVKTPYLRKNKVGSKAFKGVNSKIIIKVPKRKYSSYKKIFLNKGLGKSAKIKK